MAKGSGDGPRSDTFLFQPRAVFGESPPATARDILSGCKGRTSNATSHDTGRNACGPAAAVSVPCSHGVNALARTRGPHRQAGFLPDNRHPGRLLVRRLALLSSAFLSASPSPVPPSAASSSALTGHLLYAQTTQGIRQRCRDVKRKVSVLRACNTRAFFSLFFFFFFNLESSYNSFIYSLAYKWSRRDL